jgi:hypothetical protein
MARPAADAWRPLGLDADPVPGDPQRVTEESGVLASVATEVETQITALRQIASGNADMGKTADKIRIAATDLAGRLDAVATRYRKVASALSGWADDLAETQALSLCALDDAEAPYAILNQLARQVQEAAQPNPALAGDPITQLMAQQHAQAQAEARVQTAKARAQAELDAAIALLNRATSLRDTQAAQVAALINAATADSLADSWWDDFTNWVSDHAGILKEVAKVLQYVAVGLALLCLLIPGVDLLIIAALAVTAMLLVVHTMLAATGNGNWLDVGLDILGLVTLGVPPRRPPRRGNPVPRN